MHDKFKKRNQAARGGDRLRRKIAVEAAKRMFAAIGPREGESTLRDATEAEYYTAKRKAAAVLGHSVRPGDLPSDSEVREQILVLFRSQTQPEPAGFDEEDDDDEDRAVEAMSDHLDRFSIYKMRLDPLETVKQNVKTHPEGDALYHSLQVFELAREARPYDEEFLLAALLHDVGKAIDPRDAARAGLVALKGTLAERTAWLIGHLPEAAAYRDRTLSPRERKALQSSEHLEDLLLLLELDEAGRMPGAVVGTVAESLDFLRTLESEAAHEHDPDPMG